MRIRTGRVVVGGAVIAAACARADAYTVTNTNDSGDGSLRWAIERANQDGGGPIRFSPVTPPPMVIRPLTPLPRLESGIDIFGGWQNFSTDLRVVIDGSAMSGPERVGLRIGSDCEVSALVVANFRDGAGGGVGVRVEGSGNLLFGIFVGTDHQGARAAPNDVGMALLGAGNVVGVKDDRRETVVSGNAVGLEIASSAAVGNAVQHASIGLSRSGAPLPNTSHGVRIRGGSGTRIGGPLWWQRVRVGPNGGTGIVIEPGAGDGHTLRNAFVRASAGGLAIDLAADGVTPNDTGDGDGGPNGSQNFPAVDSVVARDGVFEIAGRLSSRPLATYAIDLYGTDAPDPSGHGEADRLLGSVEVTTDAAGDAAFTARVYGLTDAVRWVSAMATDAAGSTSEMGPVAEAAGPLPDRPTFTVNVADDQLVGPCTPDRCSLREAVAAVNREPGIGPPDLVRFAIPGGGPHVIAQRGGPLLPAFVEPVVVDGYSQPGSQPNTIPFGAGGLDTVLRIQVESRLEFEGDGSVLRGIAGTVRLVSDGNAVEGCFLGPTADGTLGDPAAGVIVHGSANRIGGRTAPQRNLISAGLSGVRLLDAGGNVLEGNLIGTTRDGHGPLPNVLCAVDVSSPDNLVGGVAPGAGNVVSGNEGYGVCLSGLSGAPATGNRVQGNWIGLDAEGDDALPNAIGLQIVWPSARDNVVGGAGAGEGNVISGNLHEGVVLRLDAHHNTVEGNLIGPAAVGSGAAGNGWEGVFISGASDNVIRGNEIRRNGFSGISVMFDSTGNVFTRNAISDNAVLGIDLGFDGVTPNDPGDVDTGPHGLLNAPDVTQAAPGQAAGRLNSVPNTTFEIETFASAGPDPTGHGEGARFLGAQSVTTDADGVAVFTVPAAFTAGEWVAATATGPEGTSEFGQGLVAPLVERRELVHGAALTADLAAAPGPVPDRDEYVLAQQPHSSYEVVVDAASGDAAPLVLERVATDGVTVLQAAEPTGTGTSLALRWENTRATPVFAEVIRVRSGGCTTGCGADDVYRIRAYETTSSIARFSNAGEQVTVLFLQNPTDAPARTTAYFWDASGALLARQPFDLAPRSLLTYFVAAGPGLAGRSGSITVSTDAGYGRLAGKTVALEPPSGFSFDSPLLPRPR